MKFSDWQIALLSMIFGAGLVCFGFWFGGCSSSTNPTVYDEESLEDDMEYINSGKTLSERLKRLREVQEEDLLNKEGE